VSVCEGGLRKVPAKMRSVAFGKVTLWQTYKDILTQHPYSLHVCPPSLSFPPAS